MKVWINELKGVSKMLSAEAHPEGAGRAHSDGACSTVPASGDRVKVPAPGKKAAFLLNQRCHKSNPGPHIYSDARKTYLVTE